MKKILLFLVCFLPGIAGLKAQGTNGKQAPVITNPNGPEMKFPDGKIHDFGDVPEGPDAVFAFEFVNAGKKPIIINFVSSGCNCTTPEWTKGKIKPGKKGKITLSYHTDGQPGGFIKDVLILSNARSIGPMDTLHILGRVLPKDGRR